MDKMEQTRKKVETRNYLIMDTCSNHTNTDPVFNRLEGNFSQEGFIPEIRTRTYHSRIIVKHKPTGLENVIASGTSRFGLSINRLGKEGMCSEDLGNNCVISLREVQETSEGLLVTYDAVRSGSLQDNYPLSPERTGSEIKVRGYIQEGKIKLEEVDTRPLTAFELYGP